MMNKFTQMPILDNFFGLGSIEQNTQGRLNKCQFGASSVSIRLFDRLQ